VFGRNLRLKVPPGVQAKTLNTEGTPRNWEVKWEARGETTHAEIMKLIGDQLSAGQWAQQRSANQGEDTSVWKFSDDDGAEWLGVVEVRPAGVKVFTVSLKVERVGSVAAKSVSDTGTP